MILTIFKLRRNGLKNYSQIEIHEQDIELLFYSPYFKLVQQKGRPKQIWHEWFLEESLYDYWPKSEDKKRQLAYLKETYPAFFSRTWIEKDEFYKTIVANKNCFLSWDDSG